MKTAAQKVTPTGTVGTNLAAATVADSERRREVLLFFACTFAITWGIASLALLIPNRLASLFGEFSTRSPLYFLAVYSPSLVALALTVTRQGWRSGGELLAKLRPRKANVGYYVAVLVGWPILDGLALLLQGAITGKSTPFLEWNHWYLAPVSLLVALVVDAGPLGEELGWRGYALPRLLSGRLSALAAALVLGVVWGVWHLPAFFIAGTAQHDDGMGIFWLILGTTLTSVIMTWLYRRTGGDVLASGLLVHLMNNMTSIPLPFVDLAYAPVAIAAGIALTIEKSAAKSERPPTR
jgi:membrane protease YdiL (CAAX protease family)